MKIVINTKINKDSLTKLTLSLKSKLKFKKISTEKKNTKEKRKKEKKKRNYSLTLPSKKKLIF